MRTTGEPSGLMAQRLARLGGCFALGGIVTGAFDIGYVHNLLVVANDAAATMQQIAAHETLFRLGFAAHMVVVLCNIPAEIIFFTLFQRVNRVLAAIALASGLIGCAIEGLDLLAGYVPLLLNAAHGTLTGWSLEQGQALALLGLRLQDVGLAISFAFYGVDEMIQGGLIARSGFLPRVIGVLLAIAGACYFSQAFISVLAPALEMRVFPYLLFPCLPGEGSTALWMALMGLNVARWTAWSATTRSAVSAPGT